MGTAGIRWSDMDGRNTWYKDGVLSRWNAYGQSKTADLLFAVELNRRMHAAGHKITANAVHPGVIHTELMRDLGSVDAFFMSLGKPFSKTVPQGAATTVFVATAPELEGIGGRYFADCNEETPRKYANNPQYASRLWEISEEMINKAPTAEEFAAQRQQQEEKEAPAPAPAPESAPEPAPAPPADVPVAGPVETKQPELEPEPKLESALVDEPIED